MKYQLTVFVPEYVKVGEDYQRVESTLRFTLDWDGMQDLLGCMIEGSEGRALKFEVKPIKTEE